MGNRVVRARGGSIFLLLGRLMTGYAAGVQYGNQHNHYGQARKLTGNQCINNTLHRLQGSLCLGQKRQK